MRILQLCKKFPYPLHDGEVIAIDSLTRGFQSAGCEVTVLAINTDKHYFPPEQLPVHQQKMAHYHAVKVNTKIKPLAALLNLFSNKSYNIQRFDSQEYRAKLATLLQQNSFDVIHLEGLYLCPYIDTIRQYAPKALLALRSHNVEFEIWERLAASARNPLKKRYLQLLARRMRHYEVQQLNRPDVLVPITDKDAAFFKQLGSTRPMHTCLTGIDIQQFVIDNTQTDYPSVFHLGAMDWLPNQEGIDWFLREVWGLVLERFPEVQCYLAGRNMSEGFLRAAFPNVHILGAVPDSKAFLSSKAIGIVPLLSGSGMRIKLVEAMAMGKTMVSTSVGAEGINARNGQDFLIADTPQAFADAICQCLQNRNMFEEIGRNARRFAEQHFDYQNIAKELLAFYVSLLKEKC